MVGVGFNMRQSSSTYNASVRVLFFSFFITSRLLNISLISIFISDISVSCCFYCDQPIQHTSLISALTESDAAHLGAERSCQHNSCKRYLFKLIWWTNGWTNSRIYLHSCWQIQVNVRFFNSYNPHYYHLHNKISMNIRLFKGGSNPLKWDMSLLSGSHWL